MLEKAQELSMASKLTSYYDVSYELFQAFPQFYLVRLENALVKMKCQLWLTNQVVVSHLLWPFHAEINTDWCLVKGDKSFAHFIKVNFLVPLASYNFDHSIFYMFYT